MQRNTIENEIGGEIATDLLQIDDNERHRSNEDIERRQNKLFEIVLGEIGAWQATWCIALSVFQSTSTMHLFAFVFQVCMYSTFASERSKQKCIP